MAGCAPVRASRGDGVEGVRHRDDACAQRNVCTGETVGIALPVHALVVMAHQSGEVRILRPSTSPTGNVHGMPLAAALGACGFDFGGGMREPPWADPERVVLIGVRSLDPGERQLVRDMGLRVFTISDIDRRGVADVVHLALDIVEVNPVLDLADETGLLAVELVASALGARIL
jgi:arginase family enzyme